jgi:hypothetical protein
MAAPPAPDPTPLRFRVERLEEALDATPVPVDTAPPLKLKETPLRLLRYRVDRIEEAVGEMQGAITLMDGSLRPLSVAMLKIKQALNALIIAADDPV